MTASSTQVDRLFSAVAEARRLQVQHDERRRAQAEVRRCEPWEVADGFFTEWQSAEAVDLPV